MVHFSQALTAALLATGVVAHPGGNTNKEILRRQAHLDHPERRNVQSCKRDLVESGWVREQHLRRENRLHELRVAAGFAKPGDKIVRRDVAEVEAEYGVSASCTLDPEATEGPYCKFVHDAKHMHGSQVLGVTGELVRQDLLNTEKGAITHLDLNVIDTSTCKPVTDAYVELWGANSTVSQYSSNRCFEAHKIRVCIPVFKLVATAMVPQPRSLAMLSEACSPQAPTEPPPSSLSFPDITLVAPTISTVRLNSLISLFRALTSCSYHSSRCQAPRQ